MDRRTWCAGLALIGCGLAASPDARAAGEPYHFSPVNQYGLQLTAGYWNPIIEYVSAKSGVRLALKIGRTSADTTSYVLAQEVDFAFTNHLFSPDRDRLGWKVLARRDAPPLRGELVVLEDSPVKSLAQLKDQEVGYPGPEAFIAYKVPQAQLLAKEIPVKVVFGGNMDSALMQLVSGKVVAVGGNSQLIQGFARREGKKLRTLWTSEPYHDLALMSSPRISAAEAEAVRKAFVGMAGDPAGLAVLERASKAVQIGATSGFVAASERDYDNYRRFYTSAPASLR